MHTNIRAMSLRKPKSEVRRAKNEVWRCSRRGFFIDKRRLVRKEASSTRVSEACFWNLAYFARGVVKNEKPEKYAQLAFWQLPGAHFRGVRNLVSLWLEFRACFFKKLFFWNMLKILSSNLIKIGLIEWLAVWLTDWMTDWLTDWLIDGLPVWFVNWPIDWLID